MNDEQLLLLTGPEVTRLLAGRELSIMDEVAQAYIAHGAGESFLPHSVFVRFPENARNRIIALPSYLGGPFGVAGIKWIASFPGNHDLGIARASAVLILNSTGTGRPLAIMEGSIISARRTAASAALAASVLQNGSTPTVGIIGCGLINLEVVRFLLATQPEIEKFVVFDLNESQATKFIDTCKRQFEGVRAELGKDLQATLASSTLISFATTALKPHVSNLDACKPGTTILHVSLRDLTGEVILENDNVVDDVDHVCRAETSIHLAEQLAGNRSFIRCTIADVLTRRALPRRNADAITVFSPFGLGILDLAVAQLVYSRAREEHTGAVIESFFPDEKV